MKVKVLVVDDTLDIRNHTIQCLTQENPEDWNIEFDVDDFDNAKDAFKYIETTMPDIMLLDIIMPEIDGIEVCKVIKAHPRNQNIYVIMLTSMDTSEYKVKSFRAGADDYIVKPFDSAELLVRIERGVRHITERKRATIDELTQLFNRYAFNTTIEYEVERAKRYNHPLSLIMIDLDHFKNVNDTFGHDIGDSVLKELSLIVTENIRHTDMVARWGGEEFMVLLPETDLNGGKKLAENIRKAVEESNFTTAGKLTASFGVTEFSTSIEDLIHTTDTALYKAKNTGRNKVVVG